MIPLQKNQPIESTLAAAASATSVIHQIGNTPLIELRGMSAEVAPVRILAKAEWYNPGGSVKDRPALNMIRDGERGRKLTHNKILLDATSGNTGIGYAMIGAALGYRVRLVVPGNVGDVHRQILQAYGAEIIYSDPQRGSDGAIELARQTYAESPDRFFYPDQYNNPANWQAHYWGTAPEIIGQTQGRVTHFVAGLGTSGTFTGTARRLKEFNAEIRAISVQPDSPMHGLEGMKHMPTSIVPGIYDEDLADENLWVRTEDAYGMVRRLARTEGLLVGPSAGAVAAAALAVAQSLESGTVVAILSDAAYKYIGQAFWKEIINGD